MRILFTIKDGKIEYVDWDKDTFEEFKRINEGKTGILTLEIIKSEIEYYQLKYYWGYLVKPLAMQSFDNDSEKAHWFLKERFLFYKCDNEDEIPSSHRKRCAKYFYNVDGKNIFIGYVRSLSTLKHDEMDEYILKVENYLMDLGLLGIDSEGKKIREKIT